MNLETQVANLELSKQLKELGYPQDSLFHWVKYSNLGKIEYAVYTQRQIDKANLDEWDFEVICYAPTVAELGEELPENVLSYRWDNRYLAVAREKDNRVIYQLCSDTEANARAKMKIYLSKTNLLTMEE